MNDWEAYLATTHAHRPPVEPAEHELEGEEETRGI